MKEIRVRFYGPAGARRGLVLRPTQCWNEDGAPVPFEFIGQKIINRLQKRGDLKYNGLGEPLLSGESHVGYSVHFGRPVVGIKGIHGHITIVA